MLIEVAYDGREKHEHGVLLQQPLGQVVPPEVVVHLVEYLLLGSPLVVEVNALLLRHVPLVGKDCTVHIHVAPSLLEAVGLGSSRLALPLHHEAAVGNVAATSTSAR